MYEHILGMSRNEKYTFKKMCSIVPFIFLTTVFRSFYTIQLEFDLKISHYHTDTSLKVVYIKNILSTLLMSKGGSRACLLQYFIASF